MNAQAPAPSAKPLKTFPNHKIPPSLLFDGFTVVELKALCQEHGIDTSDITLELDYIRALTKIDNLFNLVITVEKVPEEVPVEAPWPKLEILDGDSGPALHLRTRAHILIDNGESKKLVGLPYRYGNGSEVDLLTGKYSESSFPYNGHVGSLTLKDGRQMSFPAWTTNGYAIFEKDGTRINSGGNYQIRDGGQHANGSVYSLTFTPGANKLHKFNPDTLEHNTFEIKRPHFGRLNTWGAVGAEGHVFFLPFDVPYIEFVHKDNPDEVQVLPTKIHGFMENDRSNTMYTHGRYYKNLGKIICFPRRSNAILLIDVLNLTSEEIKLPKDLIDMYPTGSKSFDSEMGPDGWIYSSPWAHPVIFRWNPITNQFQWKNVSDELYTRPNDGGNGYCTVMTKIYNEAEGVDEIFYGAGGSPKGAKLVFVK